jgi:PTH1 family peptidyl-tRNA hydrolase
MGMSNIYDLLKQLEKKEKNTSTGVADWMIVGLGNPGDQYNGTRHNAGFMTLDILSEKYKIGVTQSKFDALCGKGIIAGHSVLLLKPMTFMNQSGIAIEKAASFYKIPTEHILVLFDDISLPVGKLRIRRNGSAGGHNGIKSIIGSMGTENFPRIKIGVGQKPTPEYNLADWVLGKISQKEDLANFKQAQEKGASAVELIVNDKLEEAMNLYNS